MTRPHAAKHDPESTDPVVPVPLDLELEAGVDYREADRRVGAAHAADGVCKRVLAFYLHNLHRTRAFQSFGFTSIAHYGVERHGMERRRVNELVQVGAQLLELADIDAAYLDGHLTWSQLRQLLRVAQTTDQRAWLDRARELRTVARLRQAVDQALAGRRPSAGAGRGLPQPRFRFETDVSHDLNSHLERNRADLMRRTGRPVATDAMLEVLAEGYRFAPVDAARDAARRAAAETKDTPEWLRREVLARDGHRCTACGKASVGPTAPAVSLAASPAELPAELPAGSPAGSPADLHVHHIVFREHGGRTCAPNLTTICAGCHGMVHAGLLQIRGTAPHGLQFLDAAGNPRTPAAATLEPALRILRRVATPVASTPSPDPAPTPTPSPDPATTPLRSVDDIPDVISAAWLRDHPQLQWSGDGKSLRLLPLS
jgi:5-methylcytosine-specific restriction endonuclease McrA